MFCVLTFARWQAGLLLLLLLIGAGRSAAAQEASAPTDSTQRQPLLLHRRLVVQYDSRYSILNYHLAIINGLKVGVEWRGRLRTGAAVYFLSAGIPTRQAPPADLPAQSEASLRFRYVALYGEYVLVETPRWELSVPLQFGRAYNYVRYTLPDGSFVRTDKDFMGIVEPSVAAQLRVFRWAGLGAGLGWRQPLFTTDAIQRELNGPIFHLRAKLLLGDLYKVVRGRQRLFTQEGLRREK